MPSTKWRALVSSLAVGAVTPRCSLPTERTAHTPTLFNCFSTSARMDFFSSAAASEGGYQTLARLNSSPENPGIPGVSQHSAIYSACPTSFHDDLLSFLAFVKARQIPILPVALPDVRSVLGRGASFFVNGAAMPETCRDEVTGAVFEQDTIVALKRAIVPKDTKSIQDGLSRRINLLYTEVLTMRHPPLMAHPNILKLLGIGFEVEGHESDRNVMPILVPECAELGNLAEILEAAKREDRPLSFRQKLAFCVDVAHGLEALHACDIVHGDVKCENVLVFENEVTEDSVNSSRLMCKITDFGFSHLDASSHGFALGGSPPWQAPELMTEKFFKIETAKRTDIYSFGLLVWRLMLDGDPFEPLDTYNGETEKERRSRRNETLAALKHEDRLVDHVCDSLKRSGILSEQQLATILRVIRSTLPKDPAQRELDLARLIRLLSPDFWYKTRQMVEPERISFDTDLQLLDVEKHFHELRKADGVVKEYIARSFHDYAKGLAGDRIQNAGAAYQLAVCYAIGFGVPFKPAESIKWLEIAAMGGSQPAREALPRFIEVFANDLRDYVVSPLEESLGSLSFTKTSVNSSEPTIEVGAHIGNLEIEIRGGKFFANGRLSDGKTLLMKAAEACQYTAMEFLLLNGVPGNAATNEGVTALHFISAWDVDKARSIGHRLIQVGGNINTVARKGVSAGGTPLMWSVHADSRKHSSIILELGGNPLTPDVFGVNALHLCARLHLAQHLQLLLKHSSPAKVEGFVSQLLVEAASGESRFRHVLRHGNDWKTAPLEILKILQAWNTVFPDSDEFTSMVLAALRQSLRSSFGPSNTDIQVLFIDTCSIPPKDCTLLLVESILTDNKDMFDLLLERKVPVTGCFEQGKTLLHLCAQNPNNTTTIQYFAQELLKFDGVEVNARDSSGQTPFMDALLARKWDLARLLLHHKGVDPLTTTDAGYTIIGLIIQTLNLGAAKWAFKYSGAGDVFREKGFIVHPEKNISAIQEAAQLQLPRAHGMKTEVSGLFLFILANLMSREKIDFRSDGIMKGASALDIAAVNGNVHAVKALAKKEAHLDSGETALTLAREKLNSSHDFLTRKHLERCIFIIEQWAKDPRGTEKTADGWTKLRTLDESNIRSSWEIIAWEWKLPDKAVEEEGKGAGEEEL